MNIIKEFSEFQPKEELVKKYFSQIEEKYQIIKDSMSGHKIVLIDEKIYYLSGPFGNKKRLTNRIYFDITYDADFHEPSLRKAIKDWVDINSK